MKKLVLSLLTSSLILSTLPQFESNVEARTIHNLNAPKTVAKIKQGKMVLEGLQLGKKLSDYENDKFESFHYSRKNNFSWSVYNKEIASKVSANEYEGISDLQETKLFKDRTITRISIAKYQVKPTNQKEIRKTYGNPLVSENIKRVFGDGNPNDEYIVDNYKFATFIYDKKNKQLSLVHLTKLKSKTDMKKFNKLLNTTIHYPSILKSEWK